MRTAGGYSEMTPVLKQVAEFDWDFRDAETNEGIHSIHPYPARFIPQIPAKLIELLPPGEDQLVLDPFCGSGTTLIESIRRGHDAFGIDLHPLACQLSRVKTHPSDAQAIHSAAEKVLSDARGRYRAGTCEIPEIPRLDHWFQPEIQNAVSSILGGLRGIESLETREALEIALSSILVRVSNQDSNTRYAAVEKDVTPSDVFRGFENAAGRVADAIAGAYVGEREIGSASVLNQDILTVKKEQVPSEVGLVVTSPPYPNVYEYWLYHKYRMWWLGMDPLAVREREIGARPHYFKTDPQDETDFRDQMQQCFSLLREVMAPDGWVCFLVGRSIIRGRRIDNAELLAQAAKPEGFDLAARALRTIPSSRGSFNPAHGGDKKEHILVFQQAETR